MQVVAAPAGWGARMSSNVDDHATRGFQSELHVCSNHGCDPVHVLLHCFLYIELKIQERRLDAHESSVIFNKALI